MANEERLDDHDCLEDLGVDTSKVGPRDLAKEELSHVGNVRSRGREMGVRSTMVADGALGKRAVAGEGR